MYYIKISMPDGTLVGAERMEVLQYVKQNIGQIKYLRCSEREAQGIISLDGNEVYYLDGKKPFIDIEAKTATFIDGIEYREIVPEEPSDDPDDDIPASDSALTREELTEKVAKLEKMNALLTGMLLENREGGMKASRVYNEGDLIVVNGELYKVLVKIANGSVLTVGTNVKQTTIAAEIAALSV